MVVAATLALARNVTAEPPKERFALGLLVGGMSPTDAANAGWIAGATARARMTSGFSLALEAQHVERPWGNAPFEATQKIDTVGLVTRWHLAGRAAVEPSLGLGVHWGRESPFPYPLRLNCGPRHELTPLVSLHTGVDVRTGRGTLGLELVRIAANPGQGCTLVGYSDGRPEETPSFYGWMLRLHGAFAVL